MVRNKKLKNHLLKFAPKRLKLRKVKQLMKNASVASNLFYNKYNKIVFENEVFNI